MHVDKVFITVKLIVLNFSLTDCSSVWNPYVETPLCTCKLVCIHATQFVFTRNLYDTLALADTVQSKVSK